MFTNEQIAEMCHETNAAYCRLIGDTSQTSWADAPGWQRTSAMNGVAGALEGNTPQESHESWMAEKVADGWVHGEVKDPDAKTHPCLVPYDELPAKQKVKDELYLAVVRTLAG